MSRFAWNATLAAVWAAILGDVTLGTLAVGFVLGFAILALTDQLTGSSGYAAGYAARLARAVEFAAYFAGQLVLSSVRVAQDIVTPRQRAQPGIVAVPLDVETDAGITLLANLVSLTPGSLSLEVSDDRRTLFVHVMFLDDVDAFRRQVKDGFERRVRELLG